ncbi:glycosyltransferase family 4 protein [Pseudobutyrivibrio sp.]|uniref:glycosyltransferase family 4 protein n=1 Tax=Pseudobutyrivibrio sp. TaxID=2014367 RepID=UPI001D56F5A4|nr:glycosyltransferase family 4 protein [Pseudobutyrivibrio sp.]MBE5910039.1 glycosyltransferase family 4 protein [Pseudobutyrivibrio sp.]
MNILIVRDAFKMHGPGMHALTFGKELKRRGHKVCFCGGKGELDDIICNEGFKKYTIDDMSFSSHRILNLISNSMKIHSIVEQEKIEVVLGFNLLSTITTKVGNLFKNILYIDVVVGEGKEAYLKFFPFEYVAISEYMERRLISFGVKENKIHIVYPSTIYLPEYDGYKDDRLRIREELGIDSKDVLLTSVAMFNRLDDKTTKGQDIIANNLPYILKKNPLLKVLFVGDGEKRVIIEEKLKEYKERVFFVGKREDIPSIMFATDIFCHYPDQETFGMVLTEAMAANTPVVARNIGGIQNIVIDGKTGRLVNDEVEFRNAIVELSFDSEKRNEYGKRGRKIVEEKYTLSKVVDSLERIIYSKSKNKEKLYE